MQSKPIYPYISFGTGLRYLQDAKQGFSIHGSGFILNNIEKILRMLDQLNLAVSKRASPTRELIQLKETLSKLAADSSITLDQATNLNRIIRELRIVIEAETSGKFAFIVTEKRLDVQKLLSDVKSLMPDDLFEKLPMIAQYDLQQAGKAIAFELPTSAAFHILRATEGVLCAFYLKIVRQNRIDPLLWGPMVTGLRARRTPPPDTILNPLDHIRTSFRNPTQHPDMIYGMDEVQNLFPMCIDVISRMSQYANLTNT